MLVQLLSSLATQPNLSAENQHPGQQGAGRCSGSCQNSQVAEAQQTCHAPKEPSADPVCKPHTNVDNTFHADAS